MILAGYYTGARLLDLARLTWGNVDLAEHSISFTQKKTGAKLKVPIHPELLDYLLPNRYPMTDVNPSSRNCIICVEAARPGFPVRFAG